MVRIAKCRLRVRGQSPGPFVQFPDQGIAGGGIVRLELQGLAPSSDSETFALAECSSAFAQLPLLLKGGAELAESVGVRRIEFDCPAKGGDGLGQLLLAIKSKAELEVKPAAGGI